jgi:tRNA threonylcarbamoyladenosine biosynthesis protein TsaB
LDASTYSGSAALFHSDGELVAQTTAKMRGVHEERFMPAVAAMLRDASLVPADINSVICGAGPGSFTSLRIAASIAKGFAHGLSLPLRAVSSLLLIPSAAVASLQPGPYLAMIDAMRGDYYALPCTLARDGSVAPAGDMMLLSAADLAGHWSEAGSGMRHVGPGLQLDVEPHARGAALLTSSVLSEAPLDAGSWEPNYGRLAEAEVKLLASGGGAAG